MTDHVVEVASNRMNVHILFYSQDTNVQLLALRRTPLIGDRSAAIMDTSETRRKVSLEPIYDNIGPEKSEAFINWNVVVRSEHSHSFIDSFDNHSTASGPASCIRRRPPGNAVSGHSSTTCLVVWWLSPQGQAGDAITPHR